MYFPAGSLDDFSVDWYSKFLRAMSEPSLLPSEGDGPRHAYRFTWLRTFHHPIAVRAELGTKEPSVITKMTDGQGGYETGNLIRDEQNVLTAKQVESLAYLVVQVDLWHLPAVVRLFYPNGDEMVGCDGAEWIVEARHNEIYHVTTQWSPEEGPVRRLGLAFLDLGHVTEEEIY